MGRSGSSRRLGSCGTSRVRVYPGERVAVDAPEQIVTYGRPGLRPADDQRGLQILMHPVPDMDETISNHDYVVDPRWLSIGEIRITADIHRDQRAQRWRITVVLSRTPNQAPIHAQAVDAQLIDDQGTALNVIERPAGPFVELSEALRISVDAPFQFQDSGYAPAQLLVTYQGQTVQFRI